jgi:type VI secretion system FHA domain protein
MRITLQIENVDRLETGGQLSYSCAARGFDIGRHEHLDWSLPDPQRVISGKHCEVRYEGDRFVLYDVSTNGTFLNGSQTRMDKAHVLRSGDRLMIGDYIIVVSLEAAAGQDQPLFGSPPAAEPALSGWNAAPPVSSAAAPAWPEPSARSSPGQMPYPSEPSAGPWAAPDSGMEGRHAPPSSAPGIGTPADDVWSRQEHGWGSADPALYDPQARQPEREAVRPAQADPLDHLAQQPHLQPDPPAPPPVAPPVPRQPGTVAETPFPPLGEDEAGGGGEPMFQMPDLETPQQEQSAAAPADAAASGDPSPSPFPEPPDWGTPPVIEPEAPSPAPAAGEPPVPAAVHHQSVAAPEEPVEPVAPVPPPPPVAAPIPPATAEPAAAQAPGSDFIAAFAAGAGIPVEALKGRDQEEFARELGTILQGITGDLMSLLQARSQVKAMTRNVNRTLIKRSGNNALKFSPTPQVALQTMLSHGAEETGYLPISKAMSEAFKDIQKHHVWTYAAMQKAAARFEETLSPRAIEAEVPKSTFGGQKAKAWDRLQERWTSLTTSYDDGLVGVFTQYFTESYEEMSGNDPEQQHGDFE